MSFINSKFQLSKQKSNTQNIFNSFRMIQKDYVSQRNCVKDQDKYLHNSVRLNKKNFTSLSKQKQNKIKICAFSPYLELKKNVSEEDPENFNTDRFIPNRKIIKKESLFQDEEQKKNSENYSPPAIDPHHFTASQIYKRFIMTDSDNNDDGLVQMYNNQNFLKFNDSAPSILTEKIQFSKKTSFDFTENLAQSTLSKRKINKLPYKVLDAPALQDDFYLNLIDWSSQNFLAVGLSSNVYLWNGNNSKVTKLCDLGLSDTVTSVGWSLKGPQFTLGTNTGQLHLWDLNKMKKTRTMQGHTDRIASIAWNSSTISTGSRDKTILHRDPRDSSPFFAKINIHRQEVCGLKWSPDEQQLCSGGNDNKLFIWSLKSNEPIVKYADHLAAVKAVAWSPHQHGLLLSGGGTADKSIKFRNTLEGTTIRSIDTGSQVCNLIFSKTLNQFVSTHGYSLNEINVWKYPKMQKISTLTGHTFRVLYLAMSPDGSTVVTGAGDETLRFWNVFPSKNNSNNIEKSKLNMENIMIR